MRSSIKNRPGYTCTSLKVPVSFREQWDALVPRGSVQSTALQATLEWLEVAEDRDQLHESELFQFPGETIQTAFWIQDEVHDRVRRVARRIRVPIPVVYLAAMKTWVDNSRETALPPQIKNESHERKNEMSMEELINALHARELLGGNKTMNDTNARALRWALENDPKQGVPMHLLEGVRELLKLPPTEEIDRSICWISICALREYEKVAAARGIRMFDEARRFEPQPVGNQEVVYSFCYKLATADDDRLDSASPETIMQDAVKMHEESGKAIELEIELMRNNELFYHGDRTITERITLISAKTASIDHDQHVLAQPLRRVVELSELRENDLVLLVANCTPESEEDAQYWGASVTTVTASGVEPGVHCAGPTWVVHVKENEDDSITVGSLDPNAPGEGVFISGGGFWITQLYLLLSADEIQQRTQEREAEIEKGGENLT